MLSQHLHAAFSSLNADQSSLKYFQKYHISIKATKKNNIETKSTRYIAIEFPQSSSGQPSIQKHA